MESNYTESLDNFDSFDNLGSFENLENEIAKAQQSFYSDNGGKNKIFKKLQKYECANHITTRIPIHILMENMCTILNGTEYIYINYSTFKSFASPDNFNDIVSHIMSKIDYIAHNFSKIEVLLDLDGFTISAAERYKPFIDLLCSVCFQNNASYLSKLNKFTLYNCPSVIDTIKKMFMPLMDPSMTSKVVTILKPDSKEYVDKIARYFATNLR